jgi:hypothetical protein
VSNTSLGIFGRSEHGFLSVGRSEQPSGSAGESTARQRYSGFRRVAEHRSTRRAGAASFPELGVDVRRSILSSIQRPTRSSPDIGNFRPRDRPRARDRSSLDSLLERDGFELTVPPERKAFPRALDRFRRPSVTRRPGPLRRPEAGAQPRGFPFRSWKQRAVKVTKPCRSTVSYCSRVRFSIITFPLSRSLAEGGGLGGCRLGLAFDIPHHVEKDPDRAKSGRPSG